MDHVPDEVVSPRGANGGAAGIVSRSARCTGEGTTPSPVQPLQGSGCAHSAARAMRLALTRQLCLI
jgi:hypothetical protein